VLILDNQMSIGALFAVRILSGRVVSPLLKLSGLLQGFHEMQQSILCLEEVMLAIPETGVEDLHSQPMPPIRGSIRFDAVTFRYGKRGRPILNQLDMEVQAWSVRWHRGPEWKRQEHIGAAH
jgi:ABC-type bacteriocin/lantibiotic exporter with double-glycine peptidase domain